MISLQGDTDMNTYNKYRENPFNKIYNKCNKGSNQEKYDSMPEFPDIIDVEVTNLCNFTCKMCPVGNLRMKRKQGFMSTDLMSDIVRECSRFGTAIRIIRWGEPLMHPNLLQFVRMVKSAGLLCHINTNGFFFDNEFIHDIIEIPLDSIKFSWHYQNISNWITELYMRRAKRSKPFIQVSITEKEANELDEFKEIIGAVCDKVTINRTKSIFQTQELPIAPNCSEVFNKLSINFDGTVSACCGDFDNYMLVGNLNLQSIQEVWNGKELEDIRRKLLRNEHNDLFLCRRCDL